MTDLSASTARHQKTTRLAWILIVACALTSIFGQNCIAEPSQSSKQRATGPNSIQVNIQVTGNGNKNTVVIKGIKVEYVTIAAAVATRQQNTPKPDKPKQNRVEPPRIKPALPKLVISVLKNRLQPQPADPNDRVFNPEPSDNDVLNFALINEGTAPAYNVGFRVILRKYVDPTGGSARNDVVVGLPSTSSILLPDNLIKVPIGVAILPIHPGSTAYVDIDTAFTLSATGPLQTLRIRAVLVYSADNFWLLAQEPHPVSTTDDGK